MNVRPYGQRPTEFGFGLLSYPSLFCTDRRPLFKINEKNFVFIYIWYNITKMMTYLPLFWRKKKKKRDSIVLFTCDADLTIPH